MPTAKKILAFDLGAESGRGVLGLLDGPQLRLEVVHRFPNGAVRTLDTFHWDVLRLHGEMLHTLRLFDRLLKSFRLPVRPGLLYEGPQLRFVNVLPLCECSLIGRRHCSALLCFVALHRLKPNVPELPICEQLRARNRQAGGISAAQESNRLLICSVFRIRHLIFG